MTDEFRFPTVLRFTPEVLSGELAASTLSLASFTEAAPSEMDLEILAHEMLRHAPELARQLMELGMRKLETAGL